MADATPLPLYVSEEKGTITAKDGMEFRAVKGLSQEMAHELKMRSLDDTDSVLLENTSDRRRFGEGSYEEWYAKGRYPYALISPTGELAALIWYGPEQNPEASEGEWDTIAFRSYPPYRGAGLMSAFSALVMEEHARDFPSRTLWLECNVENEAGAALYRKLGFTERARIKEGMRILMTQ